MTNLNDDEKKGLSTFGTRPLSGMLPSPPDQLGRVASTARPPSGYAADKPSGYAADKPSGYAANLPARKTIHVPVISTFSASLQTAPVTMPRAPWEVQA